MKKLVTLLIFIFTVLFSCSIIAQQMRAIRGNHHINYPKKIMKPVGGPLPAGTYTIGVAGYFPTIDSAFNKLSVDGIAGSVTLELIDTLYTAPTTETGFFLAGPIPGTDKDNMVTIHPADNKHITINGDGLSVFTFKNTSYLTLEGKNLSDTVALTIHAHKNSKFWTNDALKFVDNSSHNVVQNITAISDEKKLGGGIIFIIEDPASLYAPDSNLIQNNIVKKAGTGIYISGYIFDVGPIKKAVGNTIIGNFVGSENDSLITWGIQVENCKNTTIENNEVWNISYNKDDILTCALGINSYYGIETIIRNNIVHSIFDSCSEFGAIGISLTGQGGEMGSNNLIYNNMIYDIHSSSKISPSYTVGIHMWHQTNPKIYFNSVYLSGKGANPYGSAALNIETACTNVDVKNNILINTRDESPYCASAIYDYTTSNLTSDYNDLYNESNQYNCFVRTGSTKYNNLSDWQTQRQDIHSITEMPNFIAPDLHIDENIPTNLEKRGAVIADINSDFDGDLRDANLPDIGADEFNGKVVSGPLTGAYSVGVNGYFPTISSAFSRLGSDGIAAPVTLELIDTLYVAPTDTFGFFLKGTIPGTNKDKRITIKPAVNKNVTIEGSGWSVISFLNASYVTIDGVALTGPTTLTIHALQNSQFIFNDCLDFLDNSDHNVVQYINIISEDYNRGGAGISLWTLDWNLGISTSDSNTIQNNFIKSAGLPIYLSGTQNIASYGNIIRENKIGSEIDSLIVIGIMLSHLNNTIIEKNTIENIKTNPGNWITDKQNAGMYVFWCDQTIIRNNIIHNIKSSIGKFSVGIHLDGNNGKRGSNNSVYNNMIYDIQSISTDNNSCVSGIQVWFQDNSKIYYNSIYLSGNGSNYRGSAALYIYNECTSVIAKNNILVNTRDESPYCASAIYDYTTTNLTSDNNDLYYEQGQYSCLVRAGGTEHKTLADWRTKNKDLNSITEMPNFTAPHLHINESVPTNLESHGVPIEGIDLDFDGEARNSDATDIGADEFNGIPTDVDDIVEIPTKFTLKQNYPNPFNSTTIIKYSIPSKSNVTLKVYDILGREVETLVNETKSPGNYTIQFNAGKLASGTYIYTMRAGNFVQSKKLILLK